MSKAFPTSLPARAKLWIASLDKPELGLQAQYNPKELQVDKQIQWSDHRQGDNRTATEPTDSSTPADLEFQSVGERTIQLELLFDGYEKGVSVARDVERLEELSTVHNPKAVEEDLRPHHCLVGWGAQLGGIRPFPCVIESLSTKYTMWDTSGKPLRAICTVKLREAERMSLTPRALPSYDVKARGSNRDR
jgi:Contractile injection system tube protein